jgi:hypothetical protein
MKNDAHKVQICAPRFVRNSPISKYPRRVTIRPWTLETAFTWAWNKPQLVRIITNARSASSDFYRRKISEGREAKVDLDAYSHVRIDRKQRLLWNLLSELSQELDWLSIDRGAGTVTIDPEVKMPWAWTDPGANHEVVQVLIAEGIVADEFTRYH